MESWNLKPAADFGLPAGERLRSVRRESGLVEAAAQRVFWVAVRAYLHTYHRLAVSGLEHVPDDGPFVVVANHSSHLDALVLASGLRPAVRAHAFPIAAGDTFFKSPMTSALAAATINALPIWRRAAGHHALDDLRARLLAERCVYLLFPEGTRSRDGRMGAFKAGIGMLLAGTDVPAVPCRVTGTFEALHAGQYVPRPVKLGLRVGEPCQFAGVSNDRAGWERVAATLAERVACLADAGV